LEQERARREESMQKVLQREHEKQAQAREYQRNKEQLFMAMIPESISKIEGRVETSRNRHLQELSSIRERVGRRNNSVSNVCS
jgi:hypothetical protein